MSQLQPLEEIRNFLSRVTAYDVLPVSFKLVMLDTSLTLKASLLTMLQNGIVSAPLWNSTTSSFAGLLTSSDLVDAIHFFSRGSREENTEGLSSVTLGQFADIKREMGTEQISTTSMNPSRSLKEACEAIVTLKAHRAPLVDVDEATNREFVVSVLTQYRVLRFIALNCKQTQDLREPISELDLVTRDVSTVSMETTLADAAAKFSELGVSCLPVVDEQGKLLNVYESYDLLTLIKGGSILTDLSLTVGEALMRRPDDYEGVLTCADSDTLADIIETIRRSRVLRLCVVDEEGNLRGLITLCDILNYLLYGK